VSPELLAQALGFGQFGVLVWLAFEVRDLRRTFSSHLRIHHSRHDDILEC